MADIGLIKLLKDKYNTPINGKDCITFHHMQLVINTVKEQQQAEIVTYQDTVESLREIILYASDYAKDVNKQECSISVFSKISKINDLLDIWCE